LIINVNSSHPIVPLTLAAADYSHVQSQQLHLELLVGPGKTLDRGNDPAHQQGLHWQHRVLRRWFGVRRNARFSFETLRSFLGKSTKMRLRIFVIFLSLSLVAQADWLRPNVDFSHYDVPLYEQIVNRITVKSQIALVRARIPAIAILLFRLGMKMRETIQNFRTLSSRCSSVRRLQTAQAHSGPETKTI
jgi:hypothetical protein